MPSKYIYHCSLDRAPISGLKEKSYLPVALSGFWGTDSLADWVPAHNSAVLSTIKLSKTELDKSNDKRAQNPLDATVKFEHPWWYTYLLFVLDYAEIHDQMETFSALLAFVRGNHR